MISPGVRVYILGTQFRQSLKFRQILFTTHKVSRTIVIRKQCLVGVVPASLVRDLCSHKDGTLCAYKCNSPYLFLSSKKSSKDRKEVQNDGLLKSNPVNTFLKNIKYLNVKNSTLIL